ALACIVVSEVIPGVPVWRVVLAHCSPLALADVRSPQPPGRLGRVLQSTVFSSHRCHARHHVAVASRVELIERQRTVSTMAGMTKASDPTTHMNAPAATRSWRADSPNRRGASAWEGYSTRSENARMADSTVFWRSATSKYGTIAQRGHCP